MALRHRRRAVARQPVGEPDGLPAEVLADQGVAAVGRVALVEEEVDDLEHRVEPAGKLLGRRDLQRDLPIAEEPLGPDEPLGDRRLGGQEGAGDLGDAEAAGGLEGQGDLRLRRERRVIAREDHRELLVAEGIAVALGSTEMDQVGLGHGQLALLAAEDAAAADEVERLVAGHLNEPGARVLGDAVVRPEPERLEHGVLDDLLGQVQVLQPESPAQAREHRRRVVAEQVVHQRVDLGRRVWGHVSGWPMKSTWRSSIRPIGRWGQSEASRTASS